MDISLSNPVVLIPLILVGIVLINLVLLVAGLRNRDEHFSPWTSMPKILKEAQNSNADIKELREAVAKLQNESKNDTETPIDDK